MGKRKVPKNQTPLLATTSEPTKKGDETVKGKKTYSLPTAAKNYSEPDNLADLPKVQIPSQLENALIELILDEQKSRKNLGDISKRITSKKLSNVYNSLTDAGFSKNQVEAAMSATIACGGDLLDALDWLCLNTQNDQLPAGFSETLHKEEEKLRPKFDTTLQIDMKQAQNIAAATDSKIPIPQKIDKLKGAEQQTSVKDWVLSYAEQESEEESEEEETEETEAHFDPTGRYSVLHGEMLELKDQAAIAKSNNNQEQHKQLSKLLREIHLEMSSLEKHPDFDKSIKSQLKESCSTKTAMKKSKPTSETQEDNLGLNLFTQTEDTSIVKPAEDAKVEVRNFEYTRSQWTGKSPKQFLIDWVRKHLPKSGPPKFTKIQVKFNQFKSIALVDRQKDGILSVTPDILCNNIKDSEHLAATLALYHLCRGQPVHQLLPPPYRNVWLDWADEEKKLKDEAVEKENKPRDQFIAKLIKKLNLEDVPIKVDSEMRIATDEEAQEDDWETLADKDQLNEIATGSKSSASTQNLAKRNKRSDGSYLQKALANRRSSPEYLELLRSRQMLPVFQYKEQLLCAIQDHNVVIIAGETGSGKSTQVPQFLLEDCIDRGLSEVYVVCTQPRRISATSLANRVSSELGENGLDQKEALVGYQIRFESHKGLNTRLLYSTTGVVLRQLQNDADLKGITHLIIDEVHERSVQSDYLMIVVKEILTRRSDLKCILMSATMDSGKFSAYFQHCPVISIPGKAFEVEVLYLEDVIEKTGYVVDEDSQYTLNPKHLIQEAEAKVDITQKRGDSSTQLLTWTKEDISKIDRTNLPAETYSLRTRNAVSRLKLDRINLDLIMDLLNYLEKSPPYCNKDGAVLIFLPGYSDIQELYEMLTSHRQFNNTARYQIYALHSLLSSNDQTKVFLVPPPGVRKIVLATNIAETGITIPDVVYVIDSGKAKENRYMESSQMSSLEEVFISKANCKQRTGRAGRVKEGYCFRLFTKEQFNEFKPYTKPELLRVPLEELCLNIMKCQYGKPLEFLNRALDPPQTLAVSRAMSLLKEVGACYVDESSLTPLGHHLAALPVNIRIGKMLLLGSIFGCLEPIAIIAASMTEKSPFVAPLSKKSEADIAKQSLAVYCSDHITLYNAFKGWQKSKLDGKAAENAYISKHFLKKSTLNEIENVTRDLVKLVESIGFDSKRKTSKDVKFDDLVPVALIKAVLTAGMYPQVGQVITSPPIDTSEKSVCLVNTSQGVAQVHPSSVNRHLNASGSWMIYHEKVKVSQVYLRTTSIVTPYSLLLFGGAIDVQHTQKLVLLDSWIQFKAMAKTGVIFKEVRLLLNSILEKKLQTPSLNISDCPLIFLLKDLLRSEMSR
ncbi:ATP-dependent RNA helicase dhx29-like isoform X1 [Biomphalaria glabrata]|uniref:RNA helicase n=2 Tax=Biomphalaria glabrata TaxID=6526 RepID=A0A9W2YLE5_BIOGL|nr:ATP-dependent RNA helicase dhx29-like isoform X1 [Biomphalaria glabrata]XP_055863491.1 ATP-dependent RNA helicase dhx29-like isoform X1 [Biomphalaria glabrata]XP_055863492.1 ATP-dependent RNA helicase dhx29-like isoform X1 [Biomphalaria glabrata]KAI8736249.1 ATP-dependent RNA helicase DHX29-like [Biomphalaria glabrata]